MHGRRRRSESESKLTTYFKGLVRPNRDVCCTLLCSSQMEALISTDTARVLLEGVNSGQLWVNFVLPASDNMLAQSQDYWQTTQTYLERWVHAFLQGTNQEFRDRVKVLSLVSGPFVAPWASGPNIFTVTRRIDERKPYELEAYEIVECIAIARRPIEVVVYHSSASGIVPYTEGIHIQAYCEFFEDLTRNWHDSRGELWIATNTRWQEHALHAQ